MASALHPVEPSEMSTLEEVTGAAYVAASHAKRPYTEEFFAAAFQVLHRFNAFAMRDRLGSHLLPCGAYMLVLQIAFYITGGCVASLAQGDTTL
jgi:hypothetical protein